MRAVGRLTITPDFACRKASARGPGVTYVAPSTTLRLHQPANFSHALHCLSQPNPDICKQDLGVETHSPATTGRLLGGRQPYWDRTSVFPCSTLFVLQSSAPHIA
jgi:hypothetical protein